MEMNGNPEPWLLPQLRRLAKARRTDYEAFEAHVKQFLPGLYEELCLMAVEHGDLANESCAVCLCTDVSELAVRLEIYRRDSSENGDPILLEVDAQKNAKLTAAGTYVWEIVRKFRELGSLEALQEAYSGLTASEIRAALTYAERHAEEIDAKIAAYESRFQPTA